MSPQSPTHPVKRPDLTRDTPSEQAETQALRGELVKAHLDDPQAGATTAEYGIVMLAAVGFAGLLVLILKSDEVRELLMGIVRNALSTGA